MFGKRAAKSQLTYENWDRDDEPEKPGSFRMATETEMKNRVIKTAKRSITKSAEQSTGDNSDIKNVFSNFTGFCKHPVTADSIKPAASSFAFLSKLTAKATSATSNSVSTTVSDVKHSGEINTVSSTSSPNCSTKTTTISSSLNVPENNSLTTTFKGLFDNNTSDASKSSVITLSGSSRIFPNITRPKTSTSITFVPKSTSSNLQTPPESCYTTSASEPGTNTTKTGKKARVSDNQKNTDKSVNDSEEHNGITPEYCAKLKSLNIAFTDWICMHVQNNPVCILTPTFRDYEKYLQKIEKEKRNNRDVNTKGSFDIKPDKHQSANDTAKPVHDPSTTNTSIPFDHVATSTTSINKNDDLNENENNDGEHGKEDSDEEQSPNSTFKPIAEESAIYSKKCKVFTKKDGSFVDMGVGILYIKPVDATNKTQLLVRADTVLGNILVNLILTPDIPTKRMGKNNVLMVCVPTPEVSKPESVLLRVKNSEEADDLLKTIEMYKK